MERLSSPCPFLSQKPGSESLGGCPMQIGHKRRVPSLDCEIQSAFDETYQSPLKHLLSRKGPGECRSTFQKYPVYLKHTLFHLQDDYFTKIRQQTLDQRYLIFEQLKEMGNKEFHKGRLPQAVSLYEQANSLVVWLECRDPASLQTYHDQNTSLVQSHRDTPLQHMGDSMLFQVYLSLATAYMRMHHFRLARTACQDALRLRKVSLAYFRLSQAITLDLSSTPSELEESLEMARESLKLVEEEPLFKESGPMLALLGLGDAKGCYERQLQASEKRIAEQEKGERERLAGLLRRAREIEEVEESRVRDGIVSQEEMERRVLMSNQEAYQERQEDLQNYYVTESLEKKYYQLIMHFQHNQKYDQVLIGKKDLQNVKSVLFQMSQFHRLDFFKGQTPLFLEMAQQSGVQVSQYRVKKRLRKLALQRMEEIFDQAHFNYEMYIHSLKIWLAKREKKKEETPSQGKKSLITNIHAVTVLPSLVVTVLTVCLLLWLSPWGDFESR